MTSSISSTRVHGGLPLAELQALGIDPRDVIDLSTSLSPFPAHPEVLRAVRECELHAYPDSHCAAAKDAIAHATGSDASHIVIGHGSVELLWSLVRVLGKADRPLLLVSPTFSEAKDAALAHGLAVTHVQMSEADGFAFDAERIAQAIAVQPPFAVYLCQPNNPTGAALPHPQLAHLIESHPRVPFIVDEAFLSLSVLHADAALALPPNAIRVRSLTKDHSLAGLRLGYALCTPSLSRTLEAQRPPWMVSAPAQAAIIAAMAHGEHVSEARARLLGLKADLERSLHAQGIETLRSHTAFFLARTPNGESADALRDRLLREHRVLVRSASSFGLPGYVRLPACTAQAQAKLLAAL